MSSVKYNYSIADDTENGAVFVDTLIEYIRESAIVTALDYVSTDGDDLDIWFKASLSTGDETILDGVVGDHDGVVEVIDDPPVDSDGSPIIKQKSTHAGWHYEPRCITFQTSTHKSLHNRKSNGYGLNQGTDYNDAELHFWDDEGDELEKGAEETDAEFQARLDTDCVRTDIDWWPTYDHDIIGGKMVILSAPSVMGKAYLWCVMAPDIPEVMGGSVPFVSGGIDLAFVGEVNMFGIDGRTAKTVEYDSVYKSNKLRCTIQHEAGAKHSMMKLYEHFKE